MSDIANVGIVSQIGPIHVEQLLVFVHPNFRHSHSVDTVRVFVVGKAVRMEFSEDVTDS